MKRGPGRPRKGPALPPGRKHSGEHEFLWIARNVREKLGAGRLSVEHVMALVISELLVEFPESRYGEMRDWCLVNELQQMESYCREEYLLR